MKWTNDKDNLLRELLKDKTLEECAVQLQTTISSCSNRANRLKISTKQYKFEEIKCLGCGTLLITNKKQSRKFCSHSCSATYNNIIRPQEVRDKQKETLKKKLATLPKHPKISKKVAKSIKIKKCKVCSSNSLQGRRTICDKCKDSYYKYYRVESNFTFSLKDYDFVLSSRERFILREFGMYSASNRGGNIKGVSRDHMFSVKDGFLIGVKPFVLSHPANCKLLVHADNSSKNSRSSISLNELYNRILRLEKIKSSLNEDQIKYINERLAESG